MDDPWIMHSRITLRQLEYFKATAEAGSIAAASERIHVSPPSISSAISNMEGDLGAQLFVRQHAQGLVLTPLGGELLVEAKRILAQMEGLHLLAAEATNTMRGALRIGCFEAMAPMVAPELVYGFSRLHPDVRVSMVVGYQETLIDKLRAGEVDIALTWDMQLAPDIPFEPLAQLPPHVVVGEQHPLADRPSVTVEELLDYPMILLDLPLSRDYFLSLFAKAGREPTIGFRTTSMEVVRSLVASHVGYSLSNVRPRMNYSLDGKKLQRVRLAGPHSPLSLGLASSASIRPSRVVNAFTERCRSFVSNHYVPGMADPHFFDPRVVT